MCWCAQLVRLVRASRLFERWKTKITLSYGTQTVLQCVFVLLISSHWYACIIALQATLHSDVHDTWVGQNLYGYCKPNGATGPLDGCNGLTLGSWYLAAFSWAIQVMGLSL